MIFHIVERGEWEQAKARGAYAPASLRAEGFIHCSTREQVVATANRFYRGQRGLVVLCIDEARVGVEVKYEAPVRDHGEGASERFPHLYRELRVDAVVRVVEMPCKEDGSFRLPEGL